MEEDRLPHLGTLPCQDRGEAAGAWTLPTRNVHWLPAERGTETPSSRIPALPSPRPTPAVGQCLGLKLGRTHPRRGFGLVVWSRVRVCPASLVVSVLTVSVSMPEAGGADAQTGSVLWLCVLGGGQRLRVASPSGSASVPPPSRCSSEPGLGASTPTTGEQTGQ